MVGRKYVWLLCLSFTSSRFDVRLSAIFKLLFLKPEENWIKIKKNKRIRKYLCIVRVVDIFMSKSHKESVMRLFFFIFFISSSSRSYSPVKFPQVIHGRIAFAALAHRLWAKTKFTIIFRSNQNTSPNIFLSLMATNFDFSAFNNVIFTIF